jgi:hypothetical protein
MIEVEAKNATLDTLAVTILALHVSGKQMTQAVFKQLPEGSEEEGDPMWGIVRYSGIWIIFSSKGTLYRRELRIGSPDYRAVLDATKELNRFDEQESVRARHYPYDPENAASVKRMLELAANRLALVKDLEDWQSYYDADLVYQENEIALSKLQQLFIAV